MQLYFKDVNLPVGKIKLVAHDQAVVAVLWENQQLQSVCMETIAKDENHPILLATQQQLQQYFLAQRQHFDLPLALKGTEFQQKVWQALQSIPFGEKRSYKEIAEQIGHPNAVRAVGAANAKNPIPIIVPCHRVIGSNGNLVGFSGGLSNKKLLLQLEL